jgi:hypothetical protein
MAPERFSGFDQVLSAEFSACHRRSRRSGNQRSLRQLASACEKLPIDSTALKFLGPTMLLR